MIVLDTDHVTVLSHPDDPKNARLTASMEASGEPAFATTIITVEEHFRGWLAEINRLRDVHKQMRAYDRLLWVFNFFRRWRIESFDARAADEFTRLRTAKVPIGTMDLKIAAIALVHGAKLLSANLRDFRKVPGLQVESWLD
jgi:tRNA(fMet)-specific endonuclease VapC